MRLLQRGDDGTISFTHDIADENDIPPYAILSHTWTREDREELTFLDISQQCIGKEGTPGYRKLQFCEDQAKRDGLQHFWIDTCCINKANKAELSLAIRSMFRWYRNASRCYVYMPDVSSGSSWENEFRNSRWFTRGWTLQELIAPRTVEFYARDRKRLGDRISLKQQIFETSNIPISALQGTPLSSFTVNERLSWREHRETKREEDGAYSMMGILHVYIAPLYGEGAGGAFRRLMDEVEKLTRCFRDLRLTDPHDDKKRIEDTKGGLLESAYLWIFDNANFRAWYKGPQSRLLWIKGDPGKGKTMLLCGIIDNLQRTTSDFISYYFCQGTDARLNSATAVLRGLIYLVVSQQPSLVLHLRKKYDQAGASLFEDTNAWIALSDVFLAITSDPDLKMSYLVIDALDECLIDLPKLLDLIIRTSTPSGHVKWLLSSRNESRIEQKLKLIDAEAQLSLELKQNAEHVSHAVNTYIDHKLNHLECLHDSNLRDQIRDILQRKANGTFLWVSLVLQELEKPESWNPLQVVEDAPVGLYEMYDRMLNQIRNLNTRNSETCRLLLSTAANTYRPLHLTEIGSLCGLTGQNSTIAGNTKRILAMCGSFLTIRDDQVYLVHQSVKDYLNDEAREVDFPSRARIHYNIFSQSLVLMSSTLKRDIYGLVYPGYPIEDVLTPLLDPLSTIRYSCIYWVDHLYDSISSKSVQSDTVMQAYVDIYAFIKGYYLYWLEALSLSENMSAGAVSMRKLEFLLQGRTEAKTLITLVNAASRFVMHNQAGIASSPLQAYSSALLFSPRGSLIRQYFQHEEPDWITVEPDMGQKWGALLQTISTNGERQLAMAFSHDSTYLAAASWLYEINVFDVGYSKLDRAILRYCHQGVISMAFSYDSSQLASVSIEGTITIWDLSNGKTITRFLQRGPDSAAFSHDLLQLATYDNGKAIKLWDVKTGRCKQTLEKPRENIITLAFSPDSTKLARLSKEGIVKIWNLTTNDSQTILGFDDCVRIGAFSHDLTRLALIISPEKIKIWDISNMKCQKTLNCPEEVTFVTFSHDSTLLATSSWHGPIHIWNIGSDWEDTVDVSLDQISHMAFSHDLTRIASAVLIHKQIKIWNIDNGTCEQTIQYNDEVYGLSFSPDSTLLLIIYHHAVEIWKVDGAEPYMKRRVEPSREYLQYEPLSSSLDVAILSQNSSLLVLRSGRWIELWDLDTCQRRHMLEFNTPYPMIAFSHDSTLLATVSGAQVQLWSTRTAKREKVLEVPCRPYQIMFDTRNLHLYTDMGRFSIDLLPESQTESITDATAREKMREEKNGTQLSRGYAVTKSLSIQYPGATMNRDQTWIIYGNKPLLKLPSIHQPGTSTVLGNHVAIYERISGKIRIYRFDSTKVLG